MNTEIETAAPAPVQNGQYCIAFQGKIWLNATELSTWEASDGIVTIGFGDACQPPSVAQDPDDGMWHAVAPVGMALCEAIGHTEGQAIENLAHSIIRLLAPVPALQG